MGKTKRDFVTPRHKANLIMAVVNNTGMFIKLCIAEDDIIVIR